eukprot:scaffold4707_cov164-Amphora_coffeaeformis.AAC.9
MADDEDALASSCGVPASALPLNDSACQAELIHQTTGQGIALNASTIKAGATTTQKQCLLVGRNKEADIRIQHGSISRQHAAFYYFNDESLMIKDLGTKHGTIVNGNKVDGQVTLQMGDTVQFGKVRESTFRVERPVVTKAAAATTTTTADRTTAEASQTEATNSTSVDIDQTALQQAGKGLTGRAKRQAEIAAMMASLDQDITYTKVEQPAEADPVVEDTTMPPPTAKVPPPKVLVEHAALPVSGQWEIPTESDDGRLTCTAVDPPGSRLAVGRRNATISFFDFGGMNDARRQAFCTVQPQQTDGQYPLQSLAYSPTGEQILIGLASVQPIILDRDGQFVLQFARGDMYLQDPTKTIGHTAEVTSVAWHALEKSLVFTASKDGSVRRWNVDKGKLQFEKLCCEHVWVAKSAAGRKTAVTSLAVHPSGRSFAVGTSDGTLQIWNTNRTRADKLVVAGTAAITALRYTVDGQKLASRAADETVAKVWRVSALSRNAQPLVMCLGLPTVHETASIAFSPKGDYLVAGATALKPAKEKGKPRELGSVNFYHLTSDKTKVEPCIAAETPGAGPVTVHWHPRWNQVVVGCSDGSLRVYYDTQAKDRSGGVWTSLQQSTRKRGTDDDLQALLRERAREAGPAITGEILTPLASQPKRRKVDENAEAVAKREPERPATGKHKAGGAGSAVTTFAQYIAGQSAQKDIAGKDPREALLKYQEGKSYLGKETKILDTKTMEQEEEEGK